MSETPIIEMKITLFNWIHLDPVLKAKLAGAFHIPRRGVIHVSDGQIVSDGYQYEDLVSCLTLKNLQRYTKSDKTDFIELLNLCVQKLTLTQNGQPRKPRGRPRKVQLGAVTVTTIPTFSGPTTSDTTPLMSTLPETIPTGSEDQTVQRERVS